MAWPQWLMLSLILMSVGAAMARFGQQKTDSYDLTDVLIAPAISLTLLWVGGFFEGGAKWP